MHHEHADYPGNDLASEVRPAPGLAGWIVINSPAAADVGGAHFTDAPRFSLGPLIFIGCPDLATGRPTPLGLDPERPGVAGPVGQPPVQVLKDLG